MIHVGRKLLDPKWKNWLEKANKEKKIVIDSVNQGNVPQFKDRMWKEFKPYLEEIFHKKCTYCEGTFDAGTWYDVEHYRPKAKVEDLKGNVINHPGYYWLAYDWHNFLLSCHKCNRGSAKGNKFPITGQRAMKPSDHLNLEDPMILNPLEDKPQEHLKYGRFGVISWKTVRGKETIRICKLNRDELNTARENEWNNSKYRLLIEYLDNKRIGISETSAYSAYVKHSLLSYAKDLVKDLED